MTRTYRPHLTGERRDTVRADVAAKYQAGSSIRALAAEYGRSYGWAHRLLTEAGVARRARGGARARRSGEGR